MLPGLPLPPAEPPIGLGPPLRRQSSRRSNEVPMMDTPHELKVSPAFQPFLADSGPEDKRDAIVVYKAPPLEGLPVRGRLRVLKQRLASIKTRAAAQREIHA